LCGGLLLVLAAQILFACDDASKTDTMVATMSFSTINNVIETWDTIRGKPEWEKEIGVQLFAK
jgi:hypothetical protein